MNRRSFFKIVSGFVVGAFVPGKEKAKEKPLTATEILRRRDEFDRQAMRELARKKREFEIWQIDRRLYPAYMIHEDGTTEMIPWQDLYKHS
jgi:SpoVK/Ycf46/Vps4 family AAA+-type ATPase